MGQVHFFTGVERRRRWSDDQKRAIVAAAFAPGAVVSEVARRADVSTGLIYRWRNTFGLPPPGSRRWLCRRLFQRCARRRRR